MTAREQAKSSVSVVGMAVVPGDELGRGMAAGEVFAGDAEATVAWRADGVDHGVVVLEQFVVRDVLSDLDGEVELEVRVLGDAREQVGDRLGLRVVGGDPGAHEPPGAREPLVHVDARADVLSSEQGVGRVAPGRT